MANIKNHFGSTIKSLQEINLSVVLDRIKSQEATTKAELSRELQLSQPTVSRIVDLLSDRGYVVEIGPGESSGGKKPTLIRFNPDIAYVIGVGVNIDFIEIVLADFTGTTVKRRYEKFDIYKNPEHMIETIVTNVKSIISQARIRKSKIKVVSIGIPACIEPRTNIIRDCPSIPLWEGTNVKEILAEKLKMEVLTDNMMNMSLMGERWKGAAKGIDNAVYVGMTTGISAGLLLNGNIYRGYNGSAGEIGYMYTRGRELENQKHIKYGQFESLCSELALKRGLEGKNGAADRGKIIEKILRNMSFGIANLISMFNPEVIILGGELFYHSNKYIDMINQYVGELIHFHVNIITSSLKEDAVAIGAVDYAIKHLENQIFSPFFN
ncbi:MAG: ROK family transcriptional regulator [Spirochaetales bacterium]|nr:ROK family transcriptional regulator [Spirochaetales bacterium]